jgi:hypothetical protein
MILLTAIIPGEIRPSRVIVKVPVTSFVLSSTWCQIHRQTAPGSLGLQTVAQPSHA